MAQPPVEASHPGVGEPSSAGGAGASSSEEGHGEGSLRGRFEKVLPEMFKRTFYAGLGALFTTEEGIRKIAADFHLPKDVAGYLITQAASSKDELFRVVARELRGFLEGVNLSGELQKLLTSLSFEVKTEIRFIPNDESVAGVKPEFKNEMSVKRAEADRKPRRGKKRPQ